ncbi:MAG: recombinase family protein [Pseudomonadota bacterium]
MRVSTPAQQSDRQADGLAKLCDELRFEQISGAARERPVFDALIAELRPGQSLVVWDLDRAFRSTIDALVTRQALRTRSVELKIVSTSVDTSTDEGELFYTLLAGYAQYERRIIARRTREGMAAAKRRGVHVGRPAALSAETVRAAATWIEETGLPVRYVAALLGVSRITLQRSIKRLKKE